MTEATAKAGELLKVLSRLIDVLREETRLLREMDPRAMQALQQEKIVLIGAYESMLKRLTENPGELDDPDGSLRRRIMNASTDFQNTLTENARALYAVKEANERLFKAVIQAVEDSREQPSGYSAAGALTRGGAAALPGSLSVAVDARL
ncbi:MAG: flagellar protein FlgN [Kiloniellales bacterium]|nr:flagellar protein FlgN [Kiloniellales bacterium]